MSLNLSSSKEPQGSYPMQRYRGAKEANEALLDCYGGATTRFDACWDSNAPSIAIDTEAHRSNWLAMKNRGVRLRIVVEITKENIEECRQLMMYCELRHYGGVVGNFILTDREYVAANSPLRRGEPVTDITRIGSPEIVDQQGRMFEMVWEKAVPAELRIAQLLQGFEIGETRVLSDFREALLEIRETVQQAREEIRILFPSEKVARRVTPILNLLERRSSTDGLKVMALLPISKSSQIADDFPSIEWRDIHDGKLGIGISDKKKATIIQYLDIEAETSDNAMLSALITTNEQSVAGIRSMFDILWEESKLRDREEKERAALELSFEDLRLAMDNESKRRRLFALLQDILTHDLRNYNQVAKLSAELLADESKDDPKMRMLANSLMKAIDGSTLVIQRANRFGEILAKKNIDLRPVRLGQVIDSSLDSAKRQHPEKVVRHNVFVDGMILNSDLERKVLADDSLSEVFESIYSNAIENTHSSEVSIETRIEAADPYWRISVSDSGSGIPDISKEQILRRSMQITKRAGIGLSIVYALVERYTGEIELRNRVKDDHTQGTVVEISLRKA